MAWIPPAQLEIETTGMCFGLADIQVGDDLENTHTQAAGMKFSDTCESLTRKIQEPTVIKLLQD